MRHNLANIYFLLWTASSIYEMTNNIAMTMLQNAIINLVSVVRCNVILSTFLFSFTGSIQTMWWWHICINKLSFFLCSARANLSNLFIQIFVEQIECYGRVLTLLNFRFIEQFYEEILLPLCWPNKCSIHWTVKYT